MPARLAHPDVGSTPPGPGLPLGSIRVPPGRCPSELFSTLLRNAYPSYAFLSLSELVTTKTEDAAIAPAAMMGLSRPRAARGIPRVL